MRCEIRVTDSSLAVVGVGPADAGAAALLTQALAIVYCGLASSLTAMQLNSDVVCLILHADAAAADATVARTDILYDTALFRCANFLV